MSFHVGTMTGSEVLTAVEGAEEWADLTIEDPRSVELGDDVAALVDNTRACQMGSDEGHRAVITSVYVDRGSEWMLVLHQQTPL